MRIMADEVTMNDESPEETAGVDESIEAERIETENGAGNESGVVETLRADVARMNDRHLRLAAEFDNFRKRVERERTEMYSRAQADLVGRLLDVVDDLQRVALHGEETADQAFVDGVRLVEKKMLQVLVNSGLEPVDAAGKTFDPNTMEALATVAAESVDEDDVVADVFQPGYLFRGNLIRPARVRVKQYEA
jgi:molecular chaperone GrpE